MIRITISYMTSSEILRTTCPVQLLAVKRKMGTAIFSCPFRKMFSRLDSSGWKPVPTSSRLATLPLMVTRPVEGSVMHQRVKREKLKVKRKEKSF
jgi:hypothetical protein